MNDRERDLSELDRLTSLAQGASDDVLHEIVNTMRDIINAAPEPEWPDRAVPTTPALEERHAADMARRGLRSEIADRKRLKRHGGSMVFDVDAMPIDDVREMLGKMGLSEASNILRRFIRIIARLRSAELGYLRVAARTLDPEDLRKLAAEVYDQRAEIGPTAPVAEIRGLARSIVTYGGPDAVRRDAASDLVETVAQFGWRS